LISKNTLLKKDNTELENNNKNLKNQIKEAIQKIEINDLLKEIDIEEMKLLADNNTVMNNTMSSLITKWDLIMHKDDKE
jgi:anaerobic ribonucleoside-triphosphate reductase